MDHPGRNIEDLIIAPKIALRELTPPYIDRPNPKYITHWQFSSPPPARSSTATIRASSEAVSTLYDEDRDELESINHYSDLESEEDMDVDNTWRPPKRAVAHHRTRAPDVPSALSAAFVTTDTSRLTPLVQQDASAIRSRSNSSPSTPISAPGDGPMVPARFQGFIYVPQPQVASSSPRNARAATKRYSPMPRDSAVHPTRNITQRSENESLFYPVLEVPTTTISRARASTAPGIQAENDSELLPPIRTTGFVPGEPSILSPFIRYNESAATHSLLGSDSHAPGGWSTSSISSADSNVRGRSSSSSSWASPPPDLSAGLARWSISNVKGNYPVETPTAVSSAGSLIHIPPLRGPISTSASPTTPSLSRLSAATSTLVVGREIVDRAHSSTPSQQPQDYRHVHRRSYSDI